MQVTHSHNNLIIQTIILPTHHAQHPSQALGLKTFDIRSEVWDLSSTKSMMPAACLGYAAKGSASRSGWRVNITSYRPIMFGLVQNPETSYSSESKPNQAETTPIRKQVNPMFTPKNIKYIRFPKVKNPPNQLSHAMPPRGFSGSSSLIRCNKLFTLPASPTSPRRSNCSQRFLRRRRGWKVR